MYIRLQGEEPGFSSRRRRRRRGEGKREEGEEEEEEEEEEGRLDVGALQTCVGTQAMCVRDSCVAVVVMEETPPLPFFLPFLPPSVALAAAVVVVVFCPVRLHACNRGPARPTASTHSGAIFLIKLIV